MTGVDYFLRGALAVSLVLIGMVTISVPVIVAFDEFGWRRGLLLIVGTITTSLLAALFCWWLGRGLMTGVWA